MQSERDISNNMTINQFPFWRPVVFEETAAEESQFSNILWKIGSWADQFAYLGSTDGAYETHVEPERINIRKFSFEENHTEAIPMTQTGLKIALYALSLLSLPLIALTIKIIFKWKLNSITMLKDNPNTYLAGKEIGKTRLVLVTGSLLEETTEAVVNAANARLKAGGGICGAFHDEAGEEIFDECAEILAAQKKQKIETGEAVLTTAGDLQPRIKVVVHAVGPIYDKKKVGQINYPKQLADAYLSSLQLVTNPKGHKDAVSSKIADAEPMRTIGFPSISTGIYDYPIDEAAAVALGAVKDFIEQNPDALDEVRFVFRAQDKTAPAYVDALDKL